jgi:Ca2+-binding RTX toxin-like protein
LAPVVTIYIISTNTGGELLKNLLSVSDISSRRVLGIFVGLVLLASISTIMPLQSAVAQGPTITTSADSHGGTFFGDGVLQVVINDPDADDDDVQEDITVEIDAESNTGSSSSGAFVIFETSKDSGRFEFFLLHDLSTVVASDLDAINTNGAQEYDSLFNEAPMIRFGVGEELLLNTGMFEDVIFDITVDDEEVTIDYEESSAELELDRSTYGSDSFVYIFIIDQDGNTNPTEPDSFSVTEAELNTLLFDMDGASFAGDLTFEETGANTARFQGILQLTESPSGADGELVFAEESVEATLNDIADYGTPDNVTNSTDTSSRSFDIDDEDGGLDDVATVTFSSELKLTLRDNDRNRDSDDDETLDDVVTVRVDTVGGDFELLDMEETDDNTGIFIIDLSNNELRITFLEDGESSSPGNDILELREQDIIEDIIIEYNDTRDDDGGASITSSQTVEMTLAIGTVTLPDSTEITGNFVMTLTDADLNDNPRTKDSYTFVLNDVPPYPLIRGGLEIGNLAELEFEIEGDPVDFGAQTIAYTIVETDVNTGVFTTEIAVEDFADFASGGNPLQIDDGDVLEVTYNDFMDDVVRESIDKLTIGKADEPPVSNMTCMGMPATIVGTEQNDVLNGTSGADVIVGLRGNDVINGLGGNDIICGGLGMDSITGGDGDDKLLGGNENDMIDGNAGNDLIWGGTGWDRLIGGLGNDTVRGGIGNDRLLGGDGNDSLFGQEGIDRLDGGAGQNLLVQD